MEEERVKELKKKEEEKEKKEEEKRKDSVAAHWDFYDGKLKGRKRKREHWKTKEARLLKEHKMKVAMVEKTQDVAKKKAEEAAKKAVMFEKEREEVRDVIGKLMDVGPDLLINLGQ